MNVQKDECYELGSIAKTHGLKGEVLCFLDVDNTEEYAQMDSVFVEFKQSLVPYFIQQIQIQPNNRAIIKFEEVDSIETAQALVHCKLWLPLDVLPETEEDGFYLHEVIGFQVKDINKGVLGKITNIYEGNQQDLLGMEYQGKEVLIPIVDEIVLEIDYENQIVEVNLPEGLLELYLEEE
jgi:16S rRNA processing protein RimM